MEGHKLVLSKNKLCTFFATFQAERERDVVVDHLADIDRVVDESLTMLGRYQELNNKVLPLMEDYLIALRSGHH